jgi:hypothetical protein
MNETRSRNWLMILLYMAICIVFLGSLYFVAEAFFPKTSSELIPKNDALSARFMSISTRNSSSRDAQKKALSDPIKEKILLLLNQAKKFDKSKIIYRGLEGNTTFKIDVVILELDPNSFYSYRIQIDDAKKGFRLVGQKFKLISTRRSAIQIWHFKK